MEKSSKFLNIYNLNIMLIQLYNFKTISVHEHNKEPTCLYQPDGSESLKATGPNLEPFINFRAPDTESI